MNIDLLAVAKQRPLAEQLRLIEVVSGDLIETMQTQALSDAQCLALRSRIAERLQGIDSDRAWLEVLAGIVSAPSGNSPAVMHGKL